MDIAAFARAAECQKDNAVHSPITSLYMIRLLLTSTDDCGWALLVLDGTAAATAGLDRLDDLVRLDVAVGDTAEDDVLAVEPRGDDGGDEELGAVAGAC